MAKRKRVRLFFDASVIFAAAFSTKGSAAFLVSECKEGRFQAVTSRLVLMEVARNLQQKADRNSFTRFLRLIEDQSFEISRTLVPSEINRYFKYIHAKDAHVIASADLAMCDYIVTWDRKHFKTPSLESFPVEILTPEEFVKKFSM